jgi:DNA-binding CsgD family transcriptional regulator
MPRILDGRISAGELAALRLVASGYSSRQIGARLGTTEQGIHLRLTRAARSLGARSRTHAVAIALARGLIALEEVEDQMPRQEPSAARVSASEGSSVPREAGARHAASQPRTAPPPDPTPGGTP